MNPTEIFRSRPPFGGITCQVRAAALAHQRLDDIFAAALEERGGSLVEGDATDFSNSSLMRRTRDVLTLSTGTELPVTTALWTADRDEVLVLTFPAERFERTRRCADELVSVLVDVIEGIHTRRPIHAGLVGEEAFAAARLLDLWDTELRPRPGDAGTLWPANDHLDWFPLDPV